MGLIPSPPRCFLSLFFSLPENYNYLIFLLKKFRDAIPNHPKGSPLLRRLLNSWTNSFAPGEHDTNLQKPQKQVHKMTKDANYEGSSQQAKKDLINRTNKQGPGHLKFFLLIFLNI